MAEPLNTIIHQCAVAGGLLRNGVFFRFSNTLKENFDATALLNSREDQRKAIYDSLPLEKVEITLKADARSHTKQILNDNSI